MARKHALLISLVVALALVAGVFAAVRTTELGASASSATEVSDAQIQTRDRQLDRISKRIRTQARKRPPKLSALAVPASSGASGSPGGSISSGPGPGPQLVSSSGPGSVSSGHDFDDDHGHDDFDDHDDDREDDAADAAEDRADDLADAREDALDDSEDDD